MNSQRRVFRCRITHSQIEGDSGVDEHVFPYWSFTKTAIAICALKLVEDRRVELDEPIHSYPFTLRQLLTHTAGLPDYAGLTAYQEAVNNDEKPWPWDEVFKTTMAQGFLFPPGSSWAYSNIGFTLAREIIERTAGKSFFLLFKEMIGDVLGLRTVELATTKEQFSRVFWEGARHYDPGWVYHGCLIGTAQDAARLLDGLLTGRLLGPAAMEEMLRRHPLGGAIDGRPWTECGYALGSHERPFRRSGARHRAFWRRSILRERRLSLPRPERSRYCCMLH